MNLYQDIFFRSLDRLRGRRNVERLRFLRQSQYWSPGELARWQLQRLNELLLQAARHSRFHARRLAKRRLPLTSLAELAQVPVLSKRDIQRQREAIRATNLDEARYLPSQTGGSTGEPTRFYLDRRGKDWNRATVYRSAEWAGTGLGERSLHISGSVLDDQRARRWFSRCADALLRQRTCSLVGASADTFARHRQLLQRFRPASLWGYASGVAELARHIEAHHSDDAYPFLKAVVTSSEVLTEQDRARVGRVFGAHSVFDHYGSREMYIAAECSAHLGYHMHAEVVLVEIVDEHGAPCPPGQVGRVLVTDLTNHAFPFIRYEIGDLAATMEPDPCPCGVTLPRLARVEGRMADVVVLPDRILMPPSFVTLIERHPGVRRFQVQQDEAGAIRVVVEPERELCPEVPTKIARAIEELVAGRARVDVVLGQPEVSPTSGKRRLVVSRFARAPVLGHPGSK